MPAIPSISIGQAYLSICLNRAPSMLRLFGKSFQKNSVITEVHAKLI